MNSSFFDRVGSTKVILFSVLIHLACLCLKNEVFDNNDESLNKT